MIWYGGDGFLLSAILFDRGGLYVIRIWLFGFAINLLALVVSSKIIHDMGEVGGGYPCSCFLSRNWLDEAKVVGDCGVLALQKRALWTALFEGRGMTLGSSRASAWQNPALLRFEWWRRPAALPKHILILLVLYRTVIQGLRICSPPLNPAENDAHTYFWCFQIHPSFVGCTFGRYGLSTMHQVRDNDRPLHAVRWDEFWVTIRYLFDLWRLQSERTLYY